MMRAGLYRPVHVKTLRSQKLRMLLTHRKLLQSKAIAIENDLRGTFRNFGLKVGTVGAVKFEVRTNADHAWSTEGHRRERARSIFLKSSHSSSRISSAAGYGGLRPREANGRCRPPLARSPPQATDRATGHR